MGSYERNRAWSDKHIQLMKDIIGPHLLEISSFEVDTQQAADLVVFSGRNMTIACRLRRPDKDRYGRSYADRYPWDVTIRAKHDSGAKTELAKISDGWGDWMFYGHLDDDEKEIHRWFLVSLDAFRAQLIRHKGKLGLSLIPNYDGTHFVALDVSKCQDVIVAASHLPDQGGLNL